jgi:feruloyl esterase
MTGAQAATFRERSKLMNERRKFSPPYRRFVFSMVPGFLLTLGLVADANAAEISCENLTRLKLAGTTVTSATLVAKGAFTPPATGRGGPPPNAPAGGQAGPGGRGASGALGGRGGGGGQNAVFETTPAFCRVLATVRPVPDSEIKVEVWLPAVGWNGRLEALGNGGFSSAIMYGNLAQAVVKGYAATGTNTGFDGNDSSFSIGHPEKITDWGNRAVHEMTVTAKAIVDARYGTGPKYSYWNSCSTGGRQGWVAAEYYPGDFDGLAIGDPANPMTRLQANSIYINLALNDDPASFIPPAKWPVIHDAVMNQCDAVDGLKDGLIQDPMKCNFKVESLLCKNGDAADCLTAPQIESLKKISSGSKNPRTGEQLYPGYPLGTSMVGPVAGKNPDNSAPSTFRMLFQDGNWDYHTFDFDKDTARADKLGNNTINAVNPEKLKALFAHGGKVLLYHGWEDPAISPLISVDLYNQAVKANGGVGKTYDDMRLFLVPGMFHCGGGYGPNAFDKMDVIADWVENGIAPASIVASHSTAGKVDRTRPLCPYPQVAKYKGTGSIDEAQNFVCAAP